MSGQERLRQAIDQQESLLCANVPGDRLAVVLAILRARDRRMTVPDDERVPDLVTGRRLADLGGNMALQLCLDATDDAVDAPPAPHPDLDRWADAFLHECDRLATAELVLAHCDTGFMRMVADGHGRFDAWIASKRAPTSWRERADIDWWAAWLAKCHEPEERALQAARPVATSAAPSDEAWYLRCADLQLKRMAYQLGFPPEAAIGGCTVQTYCDVLGRLIGLALRARDRGEVDSPCSERDLVDALAKDLAVDAGVVHQAVAAFTVDRENAAYHAAVPGVAAAPLVRIDANQLVWSHYGLTTEPLFFLIRELRRRDAQEYHNAAYLREGVSRQELYALFQDRRFVTSSGRIQLRRDAGDLRTDLDAVIFDRKSGTLALFELKSQDPFARSTAELARQRDAFLYANRQISGALAWLQRHGGDEILNRVDARTAKTFRVQKVYPFVLGRYLAHFADGAEPDRRAAWGTWPQLLRLLDGQPVRATDANPLASLFTRLNKDTALMHPPGEGPPTEIALGAAHLVVHSSYAAFRRDTASEQRAANDQPRTHL